MATKKVTYPYALYYSDGSYMIYDFWNEDIMKINEAMLNGKKAVSVSIGILVLDDVRSFIKQNPPPEKEPTEAAHPELTIEEIEWIALQKQLWKEGSEQ